MFDLGANLPRSGASWHPVSKNTKLSLSLFVLQASYNILDHHLSLTHAFM